MMERDILLVVDVQDRLIDTIYEGDRVVRNIEALVKTAQVYDIPILLTEQEKLGATVQQIRDALDSYEPILKHHFSCHRNKEFREKLDRSNRRRVLVTGIETHICVAQTALDLMENSYQVQVIADATSSYAREDYRVAIDRLRTEGATITTTEALMYELTRTARSQEFKQILKITKDRRAK